MTSSDSRSESVEMYLKSVAELGGAHTNVPIGQVADRLGVSPVSANEMIKRLAEMDLVLRQPYKGVTLTAEGNKAADDVIRKQRLWECFLVDHLKLDWAQAHDLACDLEHATAPVVVEALADYLGNPKLCPHGNPIPGPEHETEPDFLEPLSSLDVGMSGVIAAITPHSGDVLAYLAEKGLQPGQEVTIQEIEPFKGPLTLQVGSEEKTLGQVLAGLVLVKPIENIN